MKRSHLTALAIVSLLVPAAQVLAADETLSTDNPGIGRQIAAFVLPDTSGQLVGLADFEKSRCMALIFLGTECPIANAYVPILKDLQKEYPPEKLQIIGINSNPSDSPQEVAAHAAEYEIPFPVLVDEKQEVLSLVGARRTCEVFVLDQRRVLRYRGRVDDRFGYTFNRSDARTNNLQDAIEAVLAGEEVPVAVTEAAGCLITRRLQVPQREAVTYAEHVAPLLNKHCIDCHHSGTAAPFSLTSYQQAADWSAMIREVVVQRRMPPWHADPRFGHFVNDRRLPQKDIDTLVAWVDAGTPAGDLSTVPSLPKFAEGWRIGEPDVVFQMPKEFTVPAQGEVKYQYFVTPTNFKEDKWIQAGECRPGNRSVVHHIIVFARNPEKPKDLEWLASTAPGAEPVIFGEGLGRRIPAGSELVWQVHYTATGKEEVDRSEVGFIFCKEAPKHHVHNHGISNHKFQIPPGAENHPVQSTFRVPRDVVLLSMYPHMHLRGKSFEYYISYPGEEEEKVLSVPQYDFNWQNAYIFERPLRLPKGTRIRCVAHYDNSPANPANPDPTQTVGWGDQTWDEMMIGYVDYYVVDEGAADGE